MLPSLHFTSILKSARRCVSLVLLLMPAIIGIAEGQERNAGRKSVYVQIIIQGKVVAQQTSLPIAGVRYIAWGLGKPTDTAISDANGAFTLKLQPSRRQNIVAGIRLGVRESGTDSMVLSISEELLIRNDTSVTPLTVYRYPKATLANGEMLTGNFYLPVFGKKGQNDLQQFLGKELRYPDDAREHGTEGKVLVRFLIDETGAILVPEIVRSAGHSLDQEVLRLFGKMPPWTSGTINDKPAAMYFYLPVSFLLD